MGQVWCLASQVYLNGPNGLRVVPNGPRVMPNGPSEVPNGPNVSKWA